VALRDYGVSQVFGLCIGLLQGVSHEAHAFTGYGAAAAAATAAVDGVSVLVIRSTSTQHILFK
jgi:hypothetical protein